MLKKIFGTLLALILLAAFAGTLWLLYRKSQEPPVTFETRQPFVADIIKKTVATGSVVPRQEVDVKPQVSGIIEEIFVEPGQEVARDDLIARVRIVPDIGSLAAAENRLEVARINAENARLEYQRNRELFEQGLTAESDFLRFDLALKNAEQEIEAAEDNLAVIREGARRRSGDPSATNTLVRATTAGMVLEVPVELGDSVIETNTFNDGTTIATIADMDEMVFEGTVDESEVGKLREGMGLLLTIGAVEQERFEAVLEYISPKGVEEEGAIQFEIRAALALEDRATFIRANYSATADIVLDRRDAVLAVQESWLLFDEGEPYVEVETAPQQFERRDVVLGLSDGIVIEVVDGLDATDRVKDPNSAAA